MARVVVIGGSGHVGTYLVPRLVEAGHEVFNVSRGQRAPYTPNAAWKAVTTVEIDREAEDKAGTFGDAIRNLNADIVIDMICFSYESAEQIVEALRGEVGHFLHCGTIWVYGHNVAVPASEDDPKNPIGSYGTQKAQIEDYLLLQARQYGFPATVFRPGHIVGPGWNPLNPAGNFNLAVFQTIAQGEKLMLPNFGLETVHHVHADDVAQLIMRAIANWSASVGEAFNAVSPQAVNLRGYAEAIYRRFGHEPDIDYLPFEQWKDGQAEVDWRASHEHISRSPSHSIEKARRLLGYVPRYSSIEAVWEAINAMPTRGLINAKN